MALGAYAPSATTAQLLAYSDRQHRLPPVHAAGEGPADRRAAAGHASNASATSSGPPTTGRSSTSRRTPSPSAATGLSATCVGADTSELVYEEKDELFDIGAGRSRDKALHLCCDAAAKTSTEVRYLPADRPDRRRWKIIAPRQPDHEYDVDHRGDLFYIRTNKGAKNFRVVTAPVGEPAPRELEGVRRPSSGRDDRGHRLFADHLVAVGAGERPAADRDHRPAHRRAHRIDVSRAGLLGGPRHRTWSSRPRRFRYSYQSLVTPSSVFDYDMNTRQGDAREADRGAGRLRPGALRVGAAVRDGAATA